MIILRLLDCICPYLIHLLLGVFPKCFSSSPALPDQFTEVAISRVILTVHFSSHCCHTHPSQHSVVQAIQFITTQWESMHVACNQGCSGVYCLILICNASVYNISMDSYGKLEEVTVMDTVTKVDDTKCALFSLVLFSDNVFNIDITVQYSLREGGEDWLYKFFKVGHCCFQNSPLNLIQAIERCNGLDLQEVF